MSSTIEITKTCEWCGSTFTARKCTTRYCCKRCAEHAYKDAKRKEHVEREQAKASSPQMSDDKRLFITPAQCARLLGVCRASIYNYLAANSIPCFQFKGKTLISRESLNALFDGSHLYHASSVDKLPLIGPVSALALTSRLSIAAFAAS